MSSSSREVVASGRDHKRLDPKELPSICHLGKGFSGFVYETEWKGNKYARKDFPLGSEMCNSVFETEAKSLFALDHPNIVKCIGYTVGDSSCSLLQEYVDGNLQNTIQRRIEARRKTTSSSSSSTSHLRLVDVDEVKAFLSSVEGSRKIAKVDGGKSEIDPERELTSIIPFEASEAVYIISQIAAGMKYLHDHEVIHGDLKPKNVLISSENGATNLVKVADFGLYGTKKRIKLVSKRTQQFEILRWTAPELFQKPFGPLTDDPFTDSDTDEDVSPASYYDLKMADVYSFGLTCSHILGGKLVNPNLSLTQLRDERSHCGYKPDLPSAACPDYLRDLIHACLGYKPSSRPNFSTVCAGLARSLWSNEITSQLHLNPKTKSMEQHDHDDPESSCLQHEMKESGANRRRACKSKYDIFLSHSGNENAFVEKLYYHLIRMNWRPFFDQNSHLSRPTILEVAGQCRAGVVVLSEEYLKSKSAMLELSKLVECRVELIPLFFKLSRRDVRLHAMEDNRKPRWWWKLLMWGEVQPETELRRNAVKKLLLSNGFDFETFAKSRYFEISAKPEYYYRWAVVDGICKRLPPIVEWSTDGIQGYERLCEATSSMFLEVEVEGEAKSVLGIYGRGGSGKTTLCKSMCKYFLHKFSGRVMHLELPSDEVNVANKWKGEKEEVVQRIVRLRDVLQQLARVDESVLDFVSRVNKLIDPRKAFVKHFSWSSIDKEQEWNILEKGWAILEEGWAILENELRNKPPVFLAIDNVGGSFESRREARGYLEVRLPPGSKVLVTARYPYLVGCLGVGVERWRPIPRLERVEAAMLLLSYAAPNISSVSALKPKERDIVDKCVSICQVRGGDDNLWSPYWHPVLLKALGIYLHDVSGDDVMSWDKGLLNWKRSTVLDVCKDHPYDDFDDDI